jgi:hypothetical protein
MSVELVEVEIPFAGIEAISVEVVTSSLPGLGSSTFDELTDKVTADLPTINTPLSTALALKAPIASPTFTGTVTIPSGASISGYLTTAAAASTYATLSGGNSFSGTQTFSGSIYAADISATTFAASAGISGPGSGITALDGSNIATGTVAAARVANINLATSGNGGVTGILPIANGGTGAETASAARTNLGVPASNTAGVTGADAISNIISLTLAEYNAIAVKSESTLYIIT